jgi:hypothetical protein
MNSKLIGVRQAGRCKAAVAVAVLILLVGIGSAAPASAGNAEAARKAEAARDCNQGIRKPTNWASRPATWPRRGMDPGR